MIAPEIIGLIALALVVGCAAMLWWA